MKNLVTTAFLILGLNFVSNAQCTVSITSTDAIVCEGEAPVLTATAFGPDNQLQASNTAGNNHRGNMFDIVATNTVTILSFDASPMGNTTIEIYYKAGTWNGFANSPNDWTLIGSAPVTYTGGFVPVAVPVNVTIPAGQTYAFYVTSNSSAVSLNYSNGTNVGNVYSSDANITFLEGGGMEYPFTQGTGAVYQPRVWNGNIHYAVAGLPTTYIWGAGETTNTISPTINTTTEYTVESTVSGCPSTMYDTLSIIASLPVVSAGSDLEVCAGESVLLFGTGTESYAWDNSVTDSIEFVPTTSLNYIVTGTDSVGCTVQDTIFVDVLPLPALSGGDDRTVCFGDELLFEGQGADSYVWTNGVSDGVPMSASNSFTTVVTGTGTNGCSTNDTIDVIVHSLPVVSAGANETMCAELPLTLSGSGADSYTWNNNVVDGESFIPTVSGDYIVEGTDLNGCTDTDTMILTLLVTSPTVSLIDFGIQANQTGVTYQWINCASNQAISGATNQLYTPTQTGNYAVIVFNGMCSDTSVCTAWSTAGISESAFSAAVSVYPNPNNGQFTVSATADCSVEVTDVNGRPVKQLSMTSAEAEIDLSNEESGVYFLKLSKDGEFAMKRVVVQSK